MSKVVVLEEVRPHISIVGLSGNVHVIPYSLLNRVITGKTDITQIEEYSDIMPTIINEWREMILAGLNDNL